MACPVTAINPVTGNPTSPAPQNCKYWFQGYTKNHPVCMQMYYPRCPKVNNGLCNPNAGAFLPAITVCTQALWSF